MDNAREVVQSYGQSFDELVDLVANAMAATGYHSKHASSRESDRPSTAGLADSVVGLGFLCAKIETALSGPLRPGRGELLSGEGFLSIYAAAKRLVILFRYAQSAGSIKSRAAAEVDGEVDTLEEVVMRPESLEAVIEASHSIVFTSLQFQDGLPKPLLEQVMELRDLLEG